MGGEGGLWVGSLLGQSDMTSWAQEPGKSSSTVWAPFPGSESG